jgi:hypothetical protein
VLARVNSACLIRTLNRLCSCDDGSSSAKRIPLRAKSQRSNPRTITVDGVRDENAGAHDAEECGDYFQHGVDP